MNRTLCHRLPFVVSAAITLTALILPGSSPAEQTDLTAKLQAAVAELSETQQSALLLLLTQGKGSSNASATADPGDELRASHKEYQAAVASGDFDIKHFLARMSDDFYHYAVGDKEAIEDQLEIGLQMAEGLGLTEDGVPQISFDLDDMEVEIDGDEASAYPIGIDTPLGSFTIEVLGQLEDDGIWRVTGIDGI